jgi:2-dehydropantoate 2-reductase
MIESKPNVLIVGGGAIGSFYGALLARAGCSVSMVLRSDYRSVLEHGISVKSHRLGDLSFQPAAVYKQVEECSEAPDYLILCVKIVRGVDRAEVIHHAVGPQTTIVLIENGIDIESNIAQAFPNNQLISALAYVGVNRTGPGQVEHKTSYGRLVLGNYPTGAGNETKRLGQLLEASGIQAPVTDKIIGERWRKCVWNGAFNPVSVLAGGADTQTLLNSPGGETLLREMMEEICCVSAASGYPMPSELIDTNLEFSRTMPAYRTSMAEDFLNDRPLELDAILGNIVRAANQCKVKVPRLATIYALLQMLTLHLTR